MFSATYAKNDGFGDERYGYQNYVHDFESIPWNDDRANFNHIYPSYEVYGKLRYNNFTIKALASEKSIYSFWNTSQSTYYHDVQDKKSIHISKDVHVELSHNAKLAPNLTLDTKLTAKKIDYTRDKVVETGSNHGSDFIYDPDDPNDVFKPPVHDRTEIFPEEGIGLEFLFNWDVNAQNKLLAGTSIRVVEAGPGEYRRFNVNTGEPPPVKPAREVLYDETTDKSYGAYIEDTFYATDKVTLIGGVRIDYNDPRETVAVIMPRGAVVYKFNDSWSAKYMYNTGYVRPQMGKSYAVALSKAGSVKESEKSRAHDVALIYNSEKTQLILDVFHMTVYDMYSYDAFADAQVNTGDIFSKGFELSFKQSFLEGKLFCDLNYGYATVKKEDKFGNESTYYHGIPKHVYTAGLTYLFTDTISLNANVNGWLDLEMNNVPATSWYPTPAHPDNYSSDYLVDLNLRFANLLHGHLDLSLYVFNALDNDARLQALDDWHAWWSYARGRSAGIKASWKF
jgi:outer membrane receptor protein involved in Fe transport